MDDNEDQTAEPETETEAPADGEAAVAEPDVTEDENPGEVAAGPEDDDAVYEVPVEISAVLGTAQIQVSQLLKMGRGAVLELDRKVGDPVDILVNKRMVARGEVVVVEDRLGVTLTETMRDE